MTLPKKIQDGLELLRNSQAEIRDAMEARIGEHGKVWVEHVMAAAAACAVLKHFSDEADNEDLQAELLYATECVIVCGALKLLDKTNCVDTPLEKKIEEEFSRDILSIVKKSSMRVKLEDFDALEGEE